MLRIRWSMTCGGTVPAYDFRCEACNTLFEVTRSLGDTTPVQCPVCEAAAKRVFTPVGVVFKGSGFHNTDYRARPEARPSEATPPASCPAATDKGSCASCPAAD
jgi:putative FmdB family regulatory protein